MKISLLIIAKNELKNIKFHFNEIEKECRSHKIDFYFIDANSTDGTLEFLKSKKAKIIQQVYPGRGGAIISGFEKIYSDAYIIYSPDGNENIKDLSLFKKFILAGNDLVIASRMMDGAYNEEDAQFLKPRKLANNVFNYLINVLFNKSGKYITDSINGYRAITKNGLAKLNVDAFNYTIEYQMTIRSMKNNLKIYEFPTIEGQRLYGVTGAPSIRTGFAFIKRLLMEIFR